MNEPLEEPSDNPVAESKEQPESDGTPKFGRLLIVLVLVVLLMGVITYVSEALYS